MVSLFDTVAVEPTEPVRTNRAARQGEHRLTYRPTRSADTACWVCTVCGRAMPARNCFRAFPCIDA